MNKILIIIVILHLHNIGYAQKVLTGKIVEKRTNIVVPYASLEINDSASGTASDEAGKFILSIETTKIEKTLKVSSIGYLTRRISIDSLLGLNQSEIIISLTPKVIKLEEVLVKSKPIGAEEMVREAIENVSKNYNQQPFNMEFYSNLSVKDTIETVYKVESILSTYRAGYTQGAFNISKIVEKRETGTSPLRPELDKKSKQEHFAYHPTFHVFLIDQIGVGSSMYTVFNPKIFKKLNFKTVTFTQFDKDTVCIIHYGLKPGELKDGKIEKEKYSGTIYIATKNLAIIKHTLSVGNHHNPITIIYKEYKNHYYPYSIQSLLEVKEKDKLYKIDHKIYLKKIKLENVEVIKNEPKNWYIENVAFQKDFWDNNYPR
jgi:hypothetical protein